MGVKNPQVINRKKKNHLLILKSDGGAGDPVFSATSTINNPCKDGTNGVIYYGVPRFSQAGSKPARLAVLLLGPFIEKPDSSSPVPFLHTALITPFANDTSTIQVTFNPNPSGGGTDTTVNVPVEYVDDPDE
jgi:hypothetical protein